MKTDDLINLIASDSSRTWRFRSIVALAVFSGVVIAGAIFFAKIGFRSDIGAALESVRFLYKFVLTVTLAATAIPLVAVLGSPERRLGRKGLFLGLAPALLVGAALLELLVLPESQWMPRMVGHNARFCLTLIPLLALGPLACMLFALRRGAPSRPGLAGAIAGLAASGIAATFYAANCTDDSPLFVLAWYPIAILMVTLIGYAVGRTVLRW